MCNFLEYKGNEVDIGNMKTPADHKLIHTNVVYRRYASLFFIAGCSSTDNELITLEIVHRYVEQMDKYYGNVCELDIIFNFQKAYFILDELLLAGEMQESSKKNVLRCISQQDSLEDMEVRSRIVSYYMKNNGPISSGNHAPKLHAFHPRTLSKALVGPIMSTLTVPFHIIRSRMMVLRRSADLCNLQYYVTVLPQFPTLLVAFMYK